MPTQKSKTRTPRIPELKIEHARIIYRNFSGAAKTYNAEGLRNFHVVLDPDQARELEAVGWNIKWPKPREDGEERNPTIKVALSFKNFPPTIVQVTSRGDVDLDEDTVKNLDTAEINEVHLKISGSYYEMDDKKGFKAWLRQMVVVLSEDDFLAKYTSGRSVGGRKNNDEND